MATIEDYKKAVLARYEEEKNGEFSEFLLQPTPAKLKNLSILLLNGLNAPDRKIFDNFFNYENVTLKQIEGFDNDKFKPLCNYVKGTSKLSKIHSIDLMAVFVKLHSRPFNKFRNIKTTFEGGADEIKEKSLTVIQPEIKSPFNEPSFAENKQPVLRSLKPKQLQFSLLAMIIIVSAIGIFNNVFREKGCMVWTNDHYEEVDCDMKNTQSLFSPPVIAFDKETYKYLKKVQVSDTTTFFNPDGSARIWYGKSSNKKYEYFTYPGVHPETKKTLKEITPYIIRKYIRSSDN